MRKSLIAFLVASIGFIWVSLATQTVLAPSYTSDGNDVKIYWTDNSDWWYVDINVQNPETNDRMHFGTAKISDQSFVYTKQREWDQKVWIVPGDWGEDIQFTVSWDEPTSNYDNTHWAAITRTVIPAVPKTWPNVNIIWIILATLMIFGWYIYIKKKAGI